MENNNVVEFNELVENNLEESVEETLEEINRQIDSGEVEPPTQEELSQLMSQVKEMVEVMESIWVSTRDEFGITDFQMKEVYNFNESNREPPAEGVDPSSEEYDNFNGVYKLTADDVVRIFGEEHPIIGIEHTITLDRIHSAVEEFFQWLKALREYKQLHDAYLELIEMEEEKNIEILKLRAESEPDSEKKEKALRAIDEYYYNKNLDFLREELDDKTRDSIIKAFSDEGRISYWIEKARVKMRQMKISNKFILEISQFEKRFMDEAYHPQNNILLLYYVNLVMKSDPYDKKNKNAAKTLCMVLMLDRFVRNALDEETKNRVLDNIVSLENQFSGKL